MKAVDYLKAKDRFCVRCEECPLSFQNNFIQVYCDELQRKMPEVAVEIVENWAKENPRKTYLSVLLEKFPKALRGKTDGIPVVCPYELFGGEKWNKCNCGCNCKDCWNQECKEE